MVKFSGKDRETGRPLLGIGLTRENCERLLAGKPIKLDTSSMQALPALDVWILAGETEMDILSGMPSVHPADTEIN